MMGKFRPRQHKIDSHACTMFDSSLPDEWLSRHITSDYGIDKEVEIFDNGKSTGLIFKVQIKGTEKPTFIIDNSVLSYSMSIKDIDYLCDELGIPVVLIIVDTIKNIVWWHAIQIDADLRKRVGKAKEKGQKVIAIYISKCNVLPDTWRMLFDKVRESIAVLAVRAMTSTSPNTFISSIDSMGDLDSVIAGIGRSAALLRSAKLDRLWKMADYDELKRQADSVIESSSSSIEEKYYACLYLGKLALLKARTEKGRYSYGEIEYNNAIKLKSICKGGPIHLRSYALMSLVAAELDQNTHKDLYLYINYEVNKTLEERKDNEPLWTMMLPGERISAARYVILKYMQCHRILRYMYRTNQFSVIPLSIDLIISSMIAFLLRLRREKMMDAANQYEDSLRQMAEMAIEITLKRRDWNEASYITLNEILLCDLENRESRSYYREWGIKYLNKIEDSVVKGNALAELKSQCDILEKKKYEDKDEDEYEDMEVQKQIYAGMARSVGINLNDEEDSHAKIVNIGIDDLDPTRILKNCQYLYYALGSYGLPARMLGLPTAGSKTLFCTLNGYGLESLSLDDIYKSFYEKHCAKCISQKPHPNGWKWTRKWQREQYLKNKDKHRASP